MTDKKEDGIITEARKRYGDIIDREHYVDPNHPQMSRLNRAAQFSPFAALTGYEDLIDEAARLTKEQTQLDESRKEELANRLNLLLHMENPPSVEITFFVADAKKSGGDYQTVCGVIRKYDSNGRFLRMDDGTDIFIDDIVNIK